MQSDRDSIHNWLVRPACPLSEEACLLWLYNVEVAEVEDAEVEAVEIVEVVDIVVVASVRNPIHGLSSSRQRNRNS